MKSIAIYTVIIIACCCYQVMAKTLVRVGAYEFPPYVELDRDQTKGLTVDLINQLNKIQQEYHFQLVLTTPVRRYIAYEQAMFDAIFFEDLNWGWQQRNINIKNSSTVATDEEVFIALKRVAKSQLWFNDFSDKTITGILGYHYQIADYKIVPEVLEKKYNMTLVNDHQASIELVLKQRTDAAIVTRSFLHQYSQQHPVQSDQLLISDRVAQVYQHQLLLRPDHKLDIATLFMWVQQLLQQGKLNEQFKLLGLRHPPDKTMAVDTEHEHL
ncbi:PhnD/SsuA/transferrin family substrate-binding protein [Pseudoalteromonas mariniglutinosa]|uniref:PhnD/SsuA/transferrin family substrate-binding protein n=1 Tax=Pseudoalteromonas mariniglutinosa TaxID=206042 RepID=UPI00384A8CE3